MERSKMFLLLFVLTYGVETTGAVSCAVCTNVTHPTSCRNIVQCNLRERCFTKSYGVGTDTTFDLGCKKESDCLGSSSGTLIGRAVQPLDVSTETLLVRAVVTTQCSQCCALDNCNQNLCSAGTQVTHEIGQCTDDPTYDCQHISTLFNVCSDVQHAKTACRKFCGLCDLVDGGWSIWTGWSKCDVTCGSGHVTRSRTCTEPAPSHGGLPCSGDSNELTSCKLNPCPIHGGWSGWQSWTSCSSTCGTGSKLRHRSCDNPVPQLAGNHCFGDPVEFQACFLRSCSDGGWTSWSAWSSCKNGMKTKNRTCSNPAPSQFGAACYGNNLERDRCGPVAFTVAFPNKTRIDNDRPYFTRVLVNVGGGYNRDTARFTCPIAGVYEFTFSVQSDSTTNVNCFIKKNGVVLTYAQTPSQGYATTSTSVNVALSVGDVVNLSGCGHWDHVNTNVGTSFSGSLI